jgi:hypothetical protein
MTAADGSSYAWADIPAWQQDVRVPLLLWDTIDAGDTITRAALRDGVPLVPMVPEQFLHVSTEVYALEHRRCYVSDQVPRRTPQWERLGAALALYSVELLLLPAPADLLQALATPGSVPAWLAQAVVAPQPPPADPPGRYLKVLHMDQVEEAAIDWLWWPYLAKGTLNILDGDPGIGKSLFTLYLGAILSRGDPLPDQLGRPTLPPGGPRDTLVFSVEDSVSRTIVRRLREAGADLRRVHVVTVRVEGDDEQMIQLKTDMDLLELEIRRYRPALVIFDPLHAYLGDLDIHRANETRPLLSRLITLAEATQTTLLGIRHPAKPGQHVGKAIHRGLGSIDIGASMRCGLYIEQHPTDPALLLLCHYKTNIGVLGRTQIFSKKEGRFTWVGVSRLQADAIAGQGRGPHPQAFLEACFWLEALFAKQPSYPSTDIRDQADADEMAWASVRSAKKALGVRSQKLGKDSWLWSLDALQDLPPPFQRTTTSSTSSSSSASSTTTAPSDKQRRYSHERADTPPGDGEEVEHGEDAEEVEDAEEAGVVTEEEHDVPPSGRMRWARPAQDARRRRDTDE